MIDRVGLEFRQGMLNTTAATLAKQNLGAAQAWVENLSPVDQPKGIQGLITTWMKSDPEAASEWLGHLPAGPARDAGARQIIEQIKKTDPERAEQWRQSLSPQTMGKN